MSALMSGSSSSFGTTIVENSGYVWRRRDRRVGTGVNTVSIGFKLVVVDVVEVVVVVVVVIAVVVLNVDVVV